MYAGDHTQGERFDLPSTSKNHIEIGGGKKTVVVDDDGNSNAQSLPTGQSGITEVDESPPKVVCCLRIADTSVKVKWDEENFNVESGDHVAWLNTFGGYWHHAIVKEVSTVSEPKVTVIEWSRKGFEFKIKEGTFSIGDWRSLRRPMYKILYPETVLNANPTEVVLDRAQLSIEEYKYSRSAYHIVQNNCEHLARFCKTGKKYSHQVFQGYGSVTVWAIRILLDLLKVIAFVFFSELIESYTSWSFNQVSVLMIFVFEFIYVMVAVHLIVFKDEKLSTLPKGQYCRPIGCAIGKLSARSAIIFVFTSLFMIYLPPLFDEMENWEEIMVSAAFGVLGGILGVFISYIAFYLTPCFMCYRERGVIKNVESSKVNKVEESKVNKAEESKVKQNAESNSTSC